MEAHAQPVHLTLPTAWRPPSSDASRGDPPGGGVWAGRRRPLRSSHLIDRPLGADHLDDPIRQTFGIFHLDPDSVLCQHTGRTLTYAETLSNMQGRMCTFWACALGLLSLSLRDLSLRDRLSSGAIHSVDAHRPVPPAAARSRPQRASGAAHAAVRLSARASALRRRRSLRTRLRDAACSSTSCIFLRCVRQLSSSGSKPVLTENEGCTQWGVRCLQDWAGGASTPSAHIWLLSPGRSAPRLEYSYVGESNERSIPSSFSTPAQQPSSAEVGTASSSSARDSGASVSELLLSSAAAASLSAPPRSTSRLRVLLHAWL